MNPILIIGKADCWKEDLEKVKKLISAYDVMSVGMDCVYVEDIKYFVTYHPVDIPEYFKRRKSIGGNMDFQVISHKCKSGVDIIETHVAPTGSSALLGTAAAIRLGYQKIILCGCPIEGINKGGFRPYNYFQKGWVARFLEVKDFVRSMSGWSSQLLKEPDVGWLNT